MWDKRQHKGKRPAKPNELYYATHYHLVPLYVICGILIVAFLIIACYVRTLWMNENLNAFRPMGQMVAQAAEDLYLPSVVNPADKKQYIYSAGVRFAATNPYDTLRYSYDPGTGADPNGASIGITTTGLLRNLEAPLQSLTRQNIGYISTFQQCGKLYVIRFQPGLSQYGGFTFLTSVKLQDGRTAYIHKNTNCIHATGNNQTIASLEHTLQTVESY